MKKEVREWSMEEMEEILKKAVAFTMAEEAPVISSLASEIFGYEHAAELDMLDVYDKLNLILNNIDYYVTKRIPEVWDNMENNSKTVNLTFKQKVDENMLMRSKKGGLKKVVSEAYLRLISVYTTYRSTLWLLQHDVHIDLSSDFSTYSEKLFKGITIEETLDNFYKKAELFNKLDGFEEVNNMKLTRTCGEGENFKKFILVSAVLTTIYSFKLFVQNSSYKERIDSMDGMMSLVSDIEGSFEKLKEVLKAKEENNTDPIN